MMGNQGQSVTAASAAKTLCELSDWTLTNLRLQKILYVAHMAHLGRENGDPLIRQERFEAWSYGPVLSSLYHRVKAFGRDPIKNVFHAIPRTPPGSALKALTEMYEKLKLKTPGELVAITHRSEGAWAKHYQPGIPHIKIPNEDIREEYFDLLCA